MDTSAGTPSASEKAPSKPGCFRQAAKSRSDALYDVELVRRFNTGDETAFTMIITRYRRLLFSVAFGVLRNRGDAEEIAQDTFLRAHGGLSRFRGDSSLATWLHRIALNLSRNRYWYFHRRRRHASVSLDSALCARGDMTFLDMVTTEAMGPSRNALIGEFSDLVATCITRLGPPQREILAMTQSHSYAQIAEHFGVSIGTVKSRVARARERLRIQMSEACPEFNAADRQIGWFDPVRPMGGIEVMGS